MRDLLHPPAHRGPLIAAGALVLSVGVALEQLRVAPGAGAQLAVVGALAAALLWLALQGPTPAGGPHPHQSVLGVLGLLAFAAVLLRLAQVLDALPLGSGTVVWLAAAEAGLALHVSVRRRSAVAALIAAVAGGGALLALVDWLFDPGSVEPFRWLLLALAFVYGIASLPLRGTSARHAEQMVNAAGVATLAIAAAGTHVVLFGALDRTPVPVVAVDLPAGWALVVLVAGASLVAYAAADRAPGPAYLGVAHLAVFVAAEGRGDSLVGWPLVLLALGVIVVAAGLRPRRPLPPEPASSTRPDDQPLTVRAREEAS